MSLAARLVTPDSPRTIFDAYYRDAVQRMERAALEASEKAGRIAERRIRAEMMGAGLGRLGMAIKAKSDIESGRGIHRRGQGGFSASSVLAVRTGSKRTRGAIESYTAGAEIRPVRGRWLWIATAEAGRLIGHRSERRRLTPALYRDRGEPLGPLVFLKSVDGRPLLAVRNVGKSMVGARGGKVRSLTKRGRLYKGDRAVELAVLFIGIPRTARAARIDVVAILRDVQRQLPELFEQAMKKGGR